MFLPPCLHGTADMAGSDGSVADLAVSYLRARSWGLPGALVMMVAIGSARWVLCWTVRCCAVLGRGGGGGGGARQGSA